MLCPNQSIERFPYGISHSTLRPVAVRPAVVRLLYLCAPLLCAPLSVSNPMLEWATVHTKALWWSNRQQESAACQPHANLGGKTWHEYY
jgi:hypothetical protein